MHPKLAAAGAEVVGVPCNTAHAPLIFDVVEREVAAQLPGIRLLHLVRVTVAAMCECLPQGGTIGLLATPGTYASGVYQTHVAEADLRGHYRLLEPDEEARAGSATPSTTRAMASRQHPPRSPSGPSTI